MSSKRLVRTRADLPNDKAEDRLVAHTPANDDQPGHKVVVPDHRRFTDWSTLAALGVAGVVMLGSLGLFVWALWKWITLAVF